MLKVTVETTEQPNENKSTNDNNIDFKQVIIGQIKVMDSIVKDPVANKEDVFTAVDKTINLTLFFAEAWGFQQH